MPSMPELGKGEVEVLCSKFHRAMLKNTQMRSLYGDQPQKFMDSELELDEAIQKMHETATAPKLFQVLVEQGAVNDMKELLRHENTDIVIRIIHLIRELTEPDCIDFEDDDTISAFSLFEELLKTDTLKLLIENLRRLNEKEQEDYDAIYAILTIFDNFSKVDEDYCFEISEKTNIFDHIFHRMRVQTKLDENKLYCAEILAVYVQTGGPKVHEIFAKQNGLQKCIKLLSIYRTREKLTDDQEEYIGNIFNTVTAALTSRGGKLALAKSDRAIPVLLEFVKDKKLLKEGALKMFDNALLNCTETCAKFVECKGLKTLFGAFMKSKAKKRYKQNKENMEEHLISMIVSLFLNLRETPYLRFMNKMKEKEYEKIDRLIELHSKYYDLVEQADKAEKTAEKWKI
eukprot:UN01952